MWDEQRSSSNAATTQQERSVGDETMQHIHTHRSDVRAAVTGVDGGMLVMDADEVDGMGVEPCRVCWSDREGCWPLCSLFSHCLPR